MTLFWVLWGLTQEGKKGSRCGKIFCGIIILFFSGAGKRQKIWKVPLDKRTEMEYNKANV